MKPRIISFLPAAIWFIISFILLVMPGEDIPTSNFFDLVYFDKWVHVGMFGLLNFLISLPFLKSGSKSFFLFSIITVAVIFYGFAMEFVQKYFAEQRNFDLYDVLADASGAIIVFVWVLNRLKKSPAEKVL